jgi:phosphoribosylamine--glycine ligase
MVSAQDHKRVFDGDQGPNTGGMGAYSPAPIYTESLSRQVEDQILLATIQALKNEGISYSGVLYAGLMLTESGPKVLEYNARFGDPETQVILPRLMTDLMDILLDATSGTLDRCHVTWNENPSVCVVMASGGYPGKYQIKKEIFGLENVPTMKQIMIFHAGTTAEDDRILTSGGRVLGVTAIGETLQAAIDRAYQTVRTIHFDGAHYRNDIGYKALK